MQPDQDALTGQVAAIAAGITGTRVEDFEAPRVSAAVVGSCRRGLPHRAPVRVEFREAIRVIPEGDPRKRLNQASEAHRPTTV